MIYDRAIEVACPRCNAQPGKKCRDQQGVPAPGVLCHAARAEAWRNRPGGANQFSMRIET